MNKLLTTLTGLLLIIASCKVNKEKNTLKHQPTVYTEISHEFYELNKPDTKAKAVLVLFPGYPHTARETKQEFNILEIAKSKNIAVIFSNYNRKLWLEENEKSQLTQQLQQTFKDHQLPTDNIYFGGFSSGGNVALLISDYLTKNKNYQVAPKGVFIVDSPIDLSELYLAAEKNVKRNFSVVSVQEGKRLIATLGKNFGNPNKDISTYEKQSVFTSKTSNITNVSHLKNTKIRLYTEPDTIWWKENRMADYEQMNAYHIKKLSEKLKDSGFQHAEYIPTQNKGYRANGQRHPHSWSIVDVEGLVEWILDEKSTTEQKRAGIRY